MPVFGPRHATRWDMPDWLDPHGHYVYYAWSRLDPEEVLYIGVTSRVFVRLGWHSEHSDWWTEADHLDLMRFASRADADEAERADIARLDPTYNVVGNVGRMSAVASSW